ncbi:hypothetical protein C8R45DRAFT_942705 [Mycena sanguinolenta]|nr:hypothetical protein C8R45DRAFT_942705 [Mycena sanguinolenta]
MTRDLDQISGSTQGTGEVEISLGACARLRAAGCTIEGRNIRRPTGTRQTAFVLEATRNGRNDRNPAAAGHLASGRAQRYVVVPLPVGEDLADRGPAAASHHRGSALTGAPGRRGVWAAAVQKLDRRNIVGLAATGNGMPPASRQNAGASRPGAGA